MSQLTATQADLFRGKNWGTVVTLRDDGSPHATPVWVDTDGEHVIFNTAIGRAKEQHIRRDPRVSVVVLPAENQQAGYVSVSGTAERPRAGRRRRRAARAA
jgi:PPOX class probable F420-dependent enzyme